MKVAIIAGTIRKNRKSISVAKYIKDIADEINEASIDFEVVDLRDYYLPIFDEALPPAAAKERESQKARDWSTKLESFDAYIFVTAEYNRSIPGCLKNALDYVSRELTNKAGAIVSYGSVGGNSAADSLRLVVSRLGVNLVRNQPNFINSNDFVDTNIFHPKSQAKVGKQIRTMVSSTLDLAKLLSK